jgi:DNA repair exonuclease SbcCD ATPase subunit
MIPKHLKMENFLSHNTSSIDFDKFNIALILGNYDNESDQSNGSGKCLHKNTILTDALTGCRRTIEDLFNNNIKDFNVYGLNADLTLSPTKILCIKRSGKKNLLKITTQNGISEIVSISHPVFTNNLKTVRADKLKVGDFVAQPRSLMPINFKNLLSKEEVQILALHLAKVGLTRDSIKFINTDKDIVSMAKKLQACNQLNTSASVKDEEVNKLNKKRHPIKIIKNFLTKHDIFEKSVYKCLPECIFQLDNNLVGAFLGMFISCGGFVADIKENGNKEVSIGLRSEKLIDDLQALFQQRGIITHKRFRRIKRFDSWILTIGVHKENFINFYKLVARHIIGNKKQKLQRIYNNYLDTYSNPNFDIIPSNFLYDEYKKFETTHKVKKIGLNLTKTQIKTKNISRNKLLKYANILRSEKLYKLATSNLIWCKIKSIEPVGEDYTYDIQIDNDTKLYALNGFITHNSAIFESIAWVLFGKSRHKKADGVVKWDKRACRVEFIFEVGTNLYKIKRTRDKVIRESDVIFEQWNGQQFDSISCDTNSATDRKIAIIIGFNYEIFINSVYFKQDDISMFASSSPSKRKDILKSLLRMDKWDEYQKRAKEYVKTFSIKIGEKEKQLVHINKLEEEKIICKKSITQIKKQISDLNDEYIKLNSDIVCKTHKFKSLYGDNNINDILKKLRRDLGLARKRKQEINKKISDNENIIKYNTNSIAECQQYIKILDSRIKDKKNISIDSLKSKILRGYTKAQIISQHIQDLKKDIKLENNKCSICEKPLTKKEIFEIIERNEKQLHESEKKYYEIKNKLNRAEHSLKKKEKLINIGNKAELDKAKSEIKIYNWQTEINDSIGSNKRLLKERLSINCVALEEQINKLKIHSNEISRKSLEINIKDLEERASNFKKQIDQLNIEYGGQQRKYKELIKLCKRQKALRIEIDKLKNSYSIYTKLRGYFGKDGVQSVIIENIIEELENYSNETLTKICNEPTSISIRTQKQTDAGSWSETFDIIVKSGSRVDDFETFSGGEQFRISLAIRLALSNILSNRMGGSIKFLLLDEVSSNLDNNGLQMFINIVKLLSNDMKILIITHNERLKESFEDIITVNKTQNGSYVHF